MSNSEIVNELYREMMESATVASTNTKKETPKVEPKPALALEREDFETYSKIPFSELITLIPNDMTVMKNKEYPDFLVTVFKDDHWPNEALALIPDMPAKYLVPSDALYEILLAWEHGDKTLMYGPPGTGKTTLVAMACNITHRPYVRINGKKDTESSDVFGSMDLDGSGGTTWRDGDLTYAARIGAVLNFDEPFVVSADISMGLNPVLENPPTVVLNNMIGSSYDKRVKAHEDFRICFTDNTGGAGDVTGEYAGVDVQNTSTLDRFETIINLGYLSNKDEARMVLASCPELHADTVSKMVQVAGLVRNAYGKGEMTSTMSPRTLFSWAKKTNHYQDAKCALQYCFINRLQQDSDIAGINQIMKTVFGSNVL